MGVLDKLLRAGEGRKLKALQGLVPDISALEPEMEKLSDVEPRFVCQRCGKRGAEIRPDHQPAKMGTG